MRAMSAPRSQRMVFSSRALEAPLRRSPAKRLARATGPPPGSVLRIAWPRTAIGLRWSMARSVLLTAWSSCP